MVQDYRSWAFCIQKQIDMFGREIFHKPRCEITARGPRVAKEVPKASAIAYLSDSAPPNTEFVDFTEQEAALNHPALVLAMPWSWQSQIPSVQVRPVFSHSVRGSNGPGDQLVYPFVPCNLPLPPQNLNPASVLQPSS